MRTVHLMGIGGSGMTSLAGMFHELGWNVRGSDEKIYPPASEVLARLNISVMEGFRPENLSPPPDVVVVGNVISRPNPEAQALLASSIRYMSMPQALCEYVLPKREALVVTGTHGKTTSSSLMAWLLDQGKLDPGFFVGGIPKNFGSGYRLGTGQPFVLEGDEYDTAFFEKTPKFLHYGPKNVIITSVEFDHADIYRDLDHVKEQFVKLLNILPKDGVVLACGDEPNVRSVCSKGSPAPISFYGFQPDQLWRVGDIEMTETGTAFDIHYRNQKEVHIEYPLLGRHNVLNALACFAMGKHLGLSNESLKKGLSSFQGVRRRQDFLGEAKGVRFYDDFAHHPTAIAETLRGFEPLARKRKGKLWAILEPRSNTLRRRIFQDVLPESLSFADEIIIAPVFQKKDSLRSDEQLRPAEIVESLLKKGKRAHAPSQHEELMTFVVEHVKQGDVVVFMSNGNFAGLPRKSLEVLRDETQTSNRV